MRLNEAFAQLRAAFIEWQGILKDPQYIKRDQSITWPNAPAPMLQEPVTSADILQLSRGGQFSCRFSIDDSLVQVFYAFSANGRTVESARLAYYALDLTEPDYRETEEAVVNPVGPPASELSVPALWFRIDYTNSGSVKILHPDCHLHISSFPKTRFAVAGLPSPKQFVEFVIAQIYPEVYQEHRLSEDGSYRDVRRIDRLNQEAFSCGNSPDELYRRIGHFRIPGFAVPALTLEHRGRTRNRRGRSG